MATVPLRPMYQPAYSAAADRNKDPILGVLQRAIPAHGAALEIASGTGQHAAWFTATLPGWTWQPSDPDEDALRACAARAQAGPPNLLKPLRLDVTAPRWPADGDEFSTPFDLIYCANMLHIAPWACCAALMQGSARHLSADGVLVTYGPYLEDGTPTAPGNVDFDASLRLRCPDWGLRHLREVVQQAAAAGLELRARHAMPSNNLLLVFGRRPD